MSDALAFEPLASAATVAFWHRVCAFKLDEARLSEAPRALAARAAAAAPRAPPRLSLDSDALLAADMPVPPVSGCFFRVAVWTVEEGGGWIWSWGEEGSGRQRTY